ncbi:hypothetical protein UT300012_23700 [Paraclostridium bifermentans]
MNNTIDVREGNTLVRAFSGIKSCIENIENKAIAKRNSKGVVSKMDSINYMKIISNAKSKEDIVYIEDYLKDRKYEGIIELPSFGLDFMEALVMYKTITKRGEIIIRTTHKGMEIYENVKLKVVGRGSSLRVIIDSNKVIDYKKIDCACIEL